MSIKKTGLPESVQHPPIIIDISPEGRSDEGQTSAITIKLTFIFILI